MIEAKRPSQDKPQIKLKDMNFSKPIRLTCDLDRALYKALKHYTVEKEISIANFIRAAIINEMK